MPFFLEILPLKIKDKQTSWGGDGKRLRSPKEPFFLKGREPSFRNVNVFLETCDNYGCKGGLLSQWGLLSALTCVSCGDVGPNSQDFRKECVQVGGGRGRTDEEAELGRRFNMQMSPVSFRWRIKVWLFSTSFPLPLSSHPSLASRVLWV